MKIKLFAFPFFLLTIGLLNAQQMPRQFMHGKRGMERFMELEKIKLLETLNLDENTSVRFFTRRKKHLDEQKQLADKKDSLLLELLNNFETGEKQSDNYYKKMVRKINLLDKKLVDNKVNFINSLTDILSPKQIAKLVVFEFKFRKEIRDFFLNRRKRLMKNRK